MFRRWLIAALLTGLLSMSATGESAKVIGLLPAVEGPVLNVDIPLQLNTAFTTTDPLNVTDVERGAEPGYKTLLGPHPNVANPVGRVKAVETGGHIEFLIIRGFGYGTGARPYVGTDSSSSTSDGSIILVQKNAKRNGEPVDRYYFLKGTKMTVWTKTVPPQLVEVLPTSPWQDQYVDVQVKDGVTKIHPTLPVPADPANPVRKFVDDVKEWVARATPPLPAP